MSWEMITAISTFIYAVLFSAAVTFAYIQTRGFEKNRKLQAALSIFNELQTKTAREARRNVYKLIPRDMTELTDNEIERYLEITQEAVLPYERVGYLLHEGHIESDPIIVAHWEPIWRCWKKSESVILWAREKRGEPIYPHYFNYLFDVCESYCRSNNLPEPKIY